MNRYVDDWRQKRGRIYGLAAALVALMLVSAGTIRAQDSERFSRQTFDLGVVVSDIEASLTFYQEGIGFQELPGFEVPSAFCREAGLTEEEPLDIHVLVLGEKETATRLKLMEVPEVESKEADNDYVPSQLGYSYITIDVANLSDTLDRLKEIDVEPKADGPVRLPEGFPQHLHLAVVQDPDGNLVELIGPMDE